MIKPSTVPTFATDAALTGGPQVGQPTRLAPSAALLAQGIYMDRRVPARIFGWVLGTIGDWLTYFSKVQVKNWKVEAVDFGSTTTNHSGVIWVPQNSGVDANGNPTTDQGFWFVFTSTSGGAVAGFALPALQLQNTGVPVLDEWRGLASNRDGTLLVAVGNHTAGTDTLVYTSADHGATWTARTVRAGTNRRQLAVTFDKTSLLFCIVDDDALNATFAIATSPDGITWTAAVTAPAVGTHTAGTFTGSIPMKRSGGKIVLITTFGDVCYSSDGGVHWNVAPAAPFSNPLECTFVPAFNMYTFIFADGHTAHIDAGFVAWGTTAAPFENNKPYSITSDDVSRMIVAYHDTTANPGPGVFVSDDNGATWELVRFSANVETWYLPTVVKYNGFSQWAVLGTPTGATVKYDLKTSLKI